jgi:hypothetical protein
MRQIALCAALAVGFGIASTNATAQGVGIYVGPSYDYGPYYQQDYYADPSYSYSPRVYGYRRGMEDMDVEVEIGRPTGPGGCGTYRFWNGPAGRTLWFA